MAHKGKKIVWHKKSGKMIPSKFVHELHDNKPDPNELPATGNKLKDFRMKLAAQIKKAAKGFTLVEMLLGLSIFALVAVVCYSIFSNGIRINDRAAKSEALYREMNWSLDALALDLENMVPYEGNKGNWSAFEGSEKSLSLALPTKDGLKKIRYSLKPQPDQSQLLVREELPFLASDEAKAEPEILSTHLQPDGLQFQYAQTAKKFGKNEFVWHNKYSDIHPPAAVRIKLSFLNPNQTNTPVTVQKDVFLPLGSWKN
jgi:prepilin-type N-terminal cleavage/methylation domain-containing protein